MTDTFANVGATTSVTVGARIGRHTISRRVGAGGMGEVWAARDEKLSRDVAIKVLPGELTARPDRVARFEREARAAAALDHPNILAVHDVGTWEGRPYIVTELLAGETVRQRVGAGDLTVRKAVEFAVQIAKGLSAAHERGIVHRDLKPDNLFVTTDGTVKILDFGLAKLTQLEIPTHDVTAATTDPPPSASGIALGTVGYMAPEQVRGQSADHRADIFALGCVLYEMLTRRRAFKGETPADTMSAILSRDPDSLPQSIPSPVSAVIRRCLEKRPEDRFQSARDVAFALQGAMGTLPESVPAVRPARVSRSIAVRLPLWAAVAVVLLGLLAAGAHLGRRWLAAPPLPAVKHIGVIAFAAEGGDTEVHALADGLTETVARALAVIEQEASGGIWVVPRSDSAQQGVETARDLDRKFNATLAITGRLRRSDAGFHLDLEALEPRTGRVVRFAAIEDNAGNLSSFQEGPVMRIADMLGVALSQRARDRLAATTTTMPEAFAVCLRGCSRLAHAESAADVDEAIGSLRRAVEADPLFAVGWVALAKAWLARFGFDGDPASIERGLEAATRAARLGGRPELALRVAAGLHGAAGRAERAADALEEAAQAAPNDAEICLELAAVYQSMGRLDDAEAQIRRAIFLRPGYWVGYDRLAKLYCAQGDYEDAATEFRHVVEYAPEFALGYVKVGSLLCILERPEEGRRYFERSVEIEPTYQGLGNLGYLHFQASRFADAARTYERALQIDDSDYSLWGYTAYAYRYSGKSLEETAEKFRTALRMGEEKLRESPDDLGLLTDLAGYHAMLGEPAPGLALIERVVTAEPTDPQLIAQVAECLWDLGDRGRAIEWVGRAFATGSIQRSRFEGRPTLRDMVADERYLALVQGTAGAT